MSLRTFVCAEREPPHRLEELALQAELREAPRLEHLATFVERLRDAELETSVALQRQNNLERALEDYRRHLRDLESRVRLSNHLMRKLMPSRLGAGEGASASPRPISAQPSRVVDPYASDESPEISDEFWLTNKGQ